MTQSDKDFITRIQVSQLVTQDPYADDFYAQVYGAIMRSRLGLQSQDERVLKFSSGGGIGLGLASKGGSRRPSAMQRMEQQVERIVSNARKREEEKGLHGIPSLLHFLFTGFIDINFCSYSQSARCSRQDLGPELQSCSSSITSS
jgi:DNA topoisomerase 2-associated protein PAT1